MGCGRSMGCMAMWVLVGVMVGLGVLVKTLLAVKHQKIHAKRIKGCHEHACQHRNIGKTGTRQLAGMYRHDDFVFRVEARE